MNIIAFHAEAALHAHPSPALRLFELVDLIAADIDRSLTVERLRAILEDHPERFRILEAWQTRWSEPLGDPAVSVAGRAWVVAASDPERPPSGPRAAIRLRESVRWLGRCVDDRSPLEVSRWYAIAMAERDARAALVRRAA